jgi:hypothetical protein
MLNFAKGMTYNLFFTPFFLLLLDPGSGLGENHDPGSGINMPDLPHWVKGLAFFFLIFIVNFV